MTKIVTRLIVIGIITTICVGIMIGSVILINQRSLQDGYLINIAGKQRMLTQKITKEVFMINSQNKQGFDELNQSIKEFESNLDILQYGSQEKNIHASTNLIIIKQLNSIESQWLVFKKEVEDFQKKALNIYADRNFLEDNNLAILRLSDHIVQAMVKAKMPQNVIDEAAKQRMLIQRMAYLLIHYTNQWDSISYRELKEVCELYDSVISNFYYNKNYQKYPNIYKAIKANYEFWSVYYQHLQSAMVTQEEMVGNLKNIAVQNTDLLKQINWMVNYYSDISTHSRSYLEKFQYVAAFIMVLLALYSMRNLFNIHIHLKKFVKKTQMLAQGDFKGNLAEAIKLEGESELSLASKNLSKFLNKFHMAKETSNRAKELSDDISREILEISEEIREKLEMAQISQNKRKSIENAINLGEDIAIQSSEQLIVVARLLEKLHAILQDIEQSCKEKENNKILKK